MPDDKSKSSLVSDATRAINDAWNFLFPVAVEATVVYLTMLCLFGDAAVHHLLTLVITFIRSRHLNSQSISLEQLGLKSLLPIIVFFIVATCAYTFNVVNSSMARMLPISFVWNQTYLLHQMAYAIKLCKLPKGNAPDQLMEWIDLQLAVAQQSGNRYINELFGLEYLQKKRFQWFNRMNFCKALLVWAIGLVLVGHFHHVHPAHQLLRLLILLVVIAFVFLLCAFGTASVIKQDMRAKLRAMSVLQQATEEVPVEQRWKSPFENDMESELPGWWWIEIGGYLWWQEFQPVLQGWAGWRLNPPQPSNRRKRDRRP